MNWRNKIFPIIFIFLISIGLFQFLYQSKNISPKSNYNEQYLQLKSILESAGFVTHSIDINSINQARVVITTPNTNLPTTVYFDLNQPTGKQLTLLQKVIKIATINLKHPNLIDFGGEKPYVTLKNN